MSGHSKWATIHRQKETKDAKRGAIFTKLAGAIAVAVRAGGGMGDPETNFKLRLAMEKARQFNMPKENIARAIERGQGGGEGVNLEEVMYEGFAPGGAALVISALTDNRLRTMQHIREILDKSGGSLGGAGAVAYMFASKGEIIAGFKKESSSVEVEDMEMKIIDLGIEDVDYIENKFLIYCEREKTFEIKEKLEQLGLEVESAEMAMKPVTEIKVDEETQKRIEEIIEKLEGLEDVQKVWSNYS